MRRLAPMRASPPQIPTRPPTTQRRPLGNSYARSCSTADPVHLARAQDPKTKDQRPKTHLTEFVLKISVTRQPAECQQRQLRGFRPWTWSGVPIASKRQKYRKSSPSQSCEPSSGFCCFCSCSCSCSRCWCPSCFWCIGGADDGGGACVSFCGGCRLGGKPVARAVTS